MEQNLIEYIREWKTNKIKPENEETFITLFLEFIENFDGHFQFDGDGAYFGKQIVISRHNMGYDELTFEIAYSSNSISIYTGHHSGFWTPEFIQMTDSHSDFKKIKNAVVSLVKKQVGIE
jgi:ribonucleotide reductase beta subunit family protein with ferritin-like domain